MGLVGGGGVGQVPCIFNAQGLPQAVEALAVYNGMLTILQVFELSNCSDGV